MKIKIIEYPNMESVVIQQNYKLYHYKDYLLREVSYHYHNFFEIYYIISGEIIYVIEGKSYILKPGDIILINNKELHKPIIKQTSTTYERIIIWISREFISINGSIYTNLLTCFDPNTTNRSKLLRLNLVMQERIKNIILKLEKLQLESSFGHDILEKVYLIELLVYLNKAYLNITNEEIENAAEYDENIDNVLQYINENLGNDLSLEELANKFYLNKYHLLRKFKKNVGYTIHNYIQQKRLLMARTLLNENFSITEICSKCGFEDYSNFIRAFKKAYGLPPHKYAKKYHQIL